MKRIMGKYKGQKRFRAMNVKDGIQVRNLIYATIFEDAEADRVLEHITKENTDWEFKLYEITNA
jgi:hypothetical protein